MRLKVWMDGSEVKGSGYWSLYEPDMKITSSSSGYQALLEDIVNIGDGRPVGWAYNRRGCLTLCFRTTLVVKTTREQTIASLPIVVGMLLINKFQQETIKTSLMKFPKK